MRTIEPAARRSASSGTTKKQFARAIAARSPEPCQETSPTSGVGPAKVHAAGRNRVKPVFVLTASASRARAKHGPRALRPASAATTGAANSKNVTADETGFPGSPKQQHFEPFLFSTEFLRRRDASSANTSGLPGW